MTEQQLRKAVIKDVIDIPRSVTSRKFAIASVALAIVKRLKWQPESGKKATTIQKGFICEGIPELKEKGLSIQVRTSTDQFLMKIPYISETIMRQLGINKIDYMYSEDVHAKMPDNYNPGTPAETFNTFVSTMTEHLEREIERSKREHQEATDEGFLTAATKIVNEIIDMQEKFSNNVAITNFVRNISESTLRRFSLLNIVKKNDDEFGN